MLDWEGLKSDICQSIAANIVSKLIQREAILRAEVEDVLGVIRLVTRPLSRSSSFITLASRSAIGPRSYLLGSHGEALSQSWVPRFEPYGLLADDPSEEGSWFDV